MGSRHELIVLTTGLFIAACSAKSDGGSDASGGSLSARGGGVGTSVGSGGRAVVPEGSGGALGGSGFAQNGGAAAGGVSAQNGGAAGGVSAQSGGAAAGGAFAASGGAAGGRAPMGNGGKSSAGTSGGDPVMPPISGSCPTFATGTATIAGLSGISLQVGVKHEGTGSLLFYWHGTGSTANEVNQLIPSSVRQEILSQGGIIVSFQSSLGTGGDCSGTSTFSKDDFKVADLIAACAVRDYGIDPHRIYTTGCSAGGLQAGCMGALRSSYIAATVPNSGGEVSQQKIESTAHTPAVMTMHGGSSDVVVVSFATTSATYDEQMKKAGSFVVNCNHGGGHCQAPAALYSAGWEFMKAHPYGVAPEPYATGLPSTFPSYCSEY